MQTRLPVLGAPQPSGSLTLIPGVTGVHGGRAEEGGLQGDKHTEWFQLSWHFHQGGITSKLQTPLLITAITVRTFVPIQGSLILMYLAARQKRRKRPGVTKKIKTHLDLDEAKIYERRAAAVHPDALWQAIRSASQIRSALNLLLNL